MILEIDPASVAVVLIFAAAFIVLGAVVERSAHFFWPRDF